jgi:hypothetical protein
MVKESQSKKFCSCIKKVSKTIKKVRGVKKPTRRDKESAAIGICVTGMFHRKGKTLKKFTCAKKPTLLLQVLK